MDRILLTILACVNITPFGVPEVPDVYRMASRSFSLILLLQRSSLDSIFLFPLVIILAVGLFPFDKGVVKYALPLAIAGWLTALYHNLLDVGIIPESIQPCSQGVPCTEKYIDLFGFLTIPMLALLSFTTVIALLVFLKRGVPK